MQEINFMAELQARNPSRSPEGNNHSATQNFVNQDAHQSFPVTNIVNNGSQNYGSPQTYTPHKFIGHQTPQSLFIPELDENHQSNGKSMEDSKTLNIASLSSEIKSKETLEWEEALKNWNM